MARSGPALPGDLERACATRTRRAYRDWISDPASADGVGVSISTRPPTAASAAADPGAVTEWIESWRRTADRLPVMVTWVERRWPGFGTVTIPTHAHATGAAAITTVGGRGTWWRRTTARVDALLGLGADEPRLRAALGATAPRWTEWDDVDVDRLGAVVAWFGATPSGARYPREVAVPGVDTKWLEAHRGVVEELVAAAQSEVEAPAGLGLLTPADRVRLRVLDDAIALPLRDVEAPADQVAALWPTGGPENVLVVENLTTFLALPALPATVAVFGRGFAVETLAGIPWLTRATRVRYWGDLDSHGFAILDRLRSRIPAVRSVLMDTDTLRKWADLCVAEPKPTRAPLTRLDNDETSALEELTRGGDQRLEQERIPWDWVVPRLRAAIE